MARLVGRSNMDLKLAVVQKVKEQPESANIDTIHISHETYSLIKDDIECKYVDALNLKGINHSVKTYKVIEKSEQEIKGNKYIECNKNGQLTLKNITLNSDIIKNKADKDLIKSLQIAMKLAKGELQYVYDDHIKEWKIVKKRIDEN